MGFVLPAGVENTNSVCFYADASHSFGPLVKEVPDQTLVMVDYSNVGLIVTDYTFTVDASSNPALVVSFPNLSSSGAVLTFLLSGGIAGQQYNISIEANGLRTDVLTVNVPSSEGECSRINPIPAVYTQVPIESNGYVNTAVRYFWGRTPPANPNITDQWFDPSSETLYEWATDGVEKFWENIGSPVSEAPKNGLVYGRYNGLWVPVDAPLIPNAYMMEQLTVISRNHLASLSQTPNLQLFQLVVNGRVFFAIGASPDFSLSGRTITWLSTVYSIVPGDVVIASYTWGSL